MAEVMKREGTEREDRGKEEGEEVVEYSEEELNFEDIQNYWRAFEIAKRLPKYVFGYLYDYRMEWKSNIHRRSFVNPVIVTIKIYWKEGRIRANAPVG